jgi:hypothetical protein
MFFVVNSFGFYIHTYAYVEIYVTISLPYVLTNIGKRLYDYYAYCTILIIVSHDE